MKKNEIHVNDLLPPVLKKSIEEIGEGLEYPPPGRTNGVRSRRGKSFICLYILRIKKRGMQSEGRGGGVNG